ncbi:hypothetical protein KFK09_010088 [Dendrobium nobile]|uniref:Uncharacterized protein n=1 Tax=Dendrobium nobile TaxID=94219 RepID=A0A8T3BJ59_DENNO|nr:hypothetical protein KFK09_010088 [Dendrobium nobile]
MTDSSKALFDTINANVLLHRIKRKNNLISDHNEGRSQINNEDPQPQLACVESTSFCEWEEYKVRVEKRNRQAK